MVGGGAIVAVRLVPTTGIVGWTRTDVMARGRSGVVVWQWEEAGVLVGGSRVGGARCDGRGGMSCNVEEV